MKRLKTLASIIIASVALGATLSAQKYDNSNNAIFSSTPELPNHFSDIESKIIDFDNDGDKDVLVAYALPATQASSGKNNLFLYRNDDGYFQAIPLGQYLTNRNRSGIGLDAADYNGDGLTDILLSRASVPNGKGKIQVLQNKGNDKFETMTVTDNISQYEDIDIEAKFIDSDGDGDLDVATIHTYTGEGKNVFLYENLGETDYGKTVFYKQEIATKTAPTRWAGIDLEVMDFNSDGKVDLIVANNTVKNNYIVGKITMFKNYGSEGFSTYGRDIGSYEPAEVVSDPEIAKTSNNGLAVFCPSKTSSSINFYENSSGTNLSYSPSNSYSVPRGHFATGTAMSVSEDFMFVANSPKGVDCNLKVWKNKDKKEELGVPISKL